jgi:RNA polymerase sigma factor (sigma-70 family)
MSREEGEVASEIEVALAWLGRAQGEALAQAVAPIVRVNARRLKRFLGTGGVCPQDYVFRVAENYSGQHAYVHKVQVERCPEVWKALYVKIQRWAYGFLTRRGRPAGPATQEVAQEYAGEAAIYIIGARFPYDISFDAWACRLVQYTCCNKYRQERRGPATIDRDLSELDELLTQELSGLPVEPELAELRWAVRQAIDQIRGGARREVLVLRYFKGLSFAEIAAQLGRSLRAVYSLHFKGLESLRRTLRDWGYV